MILITIVIPSYNVEKYLSKCLDSIVLQDLGLYNIEIIVVNDGSTDSTEDIAKSYAAKFAFIQVICQPNKGLSAARNTGLSIAKGKYVWFIDSDDWIKLDSLKGLIDLCELNDIDVLAIGRIIAKDDHEYKRNINTQYKRTVISGETCLSENLFEIPAQLYIFNRAYLNYNNLYFAVGKLHEDKEFTLRSIYYARKFYYSDEFVYYHLQRSGSITKVPNPKRCLDLIDISEMTFNFAFQTGVSTNSKIIILRHAFFSLTLASIIALKLEKGEVRSQIFNRLKSYKSLFSNIIMHDKFIYKLETIMFSLSPKMFAMLYKLKGSEH